MKPPNSNYDITIIGGGIVGLTLACALGNSRLKVAVVDQQNPQPPSKKDYDLRVSAITPASQMIFANLNVWEKIQSQRISHFQKMHVWDAETGSTIDFNGAAIHTDTLGYIIENNIIQNALSEQLKTYSNIEFICPAKLQSFEIEKDKVNLISNDGRNFNTRLLIGSDGAESQVRKLANIDITTWEYGHSALIATVKTSLSHELIAHQCFLANGILAFLPLEDPHLCSIVWSTDPEEIARLLKLDAKDFNKELAKAFAYRLGDVELLSERAAYPLRMRHAKNYVQPHIALIGDAAHTIHPLAGQGVNLGILDAAVLAEIILQAHAKDRLIYSLDTLRRYERWRKTENLAMITMIEAIKRLFANQTVPIQTLRSFGLSTTDKADFIKNYLMKRAMGISGDLPELAKII